MRIGTRKSAIFTIAGGNHVSPYTDLPAAQQKIFVQMIDSWVTVQASPGKAGPAGPAQSSVPRTGRLG